MTQVLEIVTFRLAPGISAAEFRARAQAAPLASLPGFLGRTLAEDGAGGWIDLVEWASAPQAEAAAGVVMSDAAFAPFLSAIAPEGLVMRHARLD